MNSFINFRDLFCVLTSTRLVLSLIPSNTLGDYVSAVYRNFTSRSAKEWLNPYSQF